MFRFIERETFLYHSQIYFSLKSLCTHEWETESFLHLYCTILSSVQTTVVSGPPPSLLQLSKLP